MDFKTYIKIWVYSVNFFFWWNTFWEKLLSKHIEFIDQVCTVGIVHQTTTEQRTGDTIKNSARASNIYDDIVIVITVVGDPDFEEFFSLSTLACSSICTIRGSRITHRSDCGKRVGEQRTVTLIVLHCHKKKMIALFFFKYVQKR